MHDDNKYIEMVEFDQVLREEAVGSMFSCIYLGIGSALLVGYVYVLISGTDLLCKSVLAVFGIN